MGFSLVLTLFTLIQPSAIAQVASTLDTSYYTYYNELSNGDTLVKGEVYQAVEATIQANQSQFNSDVAACNAQSIIGTGFNAASSCQGLPAQADALTSFTCKSFLDGGVVNASKVETEEKELIKQIGYEQTCLSQETKSEGALNCLAGLEQRISSQLKNQISNLPINGQLKNDLKDANLFMQHAALHAAQVDSILNKNPNLNELYKNTSELINKAQIQNPIMQTNIQNLNTAYGANESQLDHYAEVLIQACITNNQAAASQVPGGVFFDSGVRTTCNYSTAASPAPGGSGSATSYVPLPCQGGILEQLSQMARTSGATQFSGTQGLFTTQSGFASGGNNAAYISGISGQIASMLGSSNVGAPGATSGQSGQGPSLTPTNTGVGIASPLYAVSSIESSENPLIAPLGSAAVATFDTVVSNCQAKAVVWENNQKTTPGTPYSIQKQNLDTQRGQYQGQIKTMLTSLQEKTTALTSLGMVYNPPASCAFVTYNQPNNNGQQTASIEKIQQCTSDYTTTLNYLMRNGTINLTTQFGVGGGSMDMIPAGISQCTGGLQSCITSLNQYQADLLQKQHGMQVLAKTLTDDYKVQMDAAAPLVTAALNGMNNQISTQMAALGGACSPAEGMGMGRGSSDDVTPDLCVSGGGGGGGSGDQQQITAPPLCKVSSGFFAQAMSPIDPHSCSKNIDETMKTLNEKMVALNKEKDKMDEWKDLDGQKCNGDDKPPGGDSSKNSVGILHCAQYVSSVNNSSGAVGDIISTLAQALRASNGSDGRIVDSVSKQDAKLSVQDPAADCMEYVNNSGLSFSATGNGKLTLGLPE